MTDEQRDLYQFIFQNEHLPAGYDIRCIDYRPHLNFVKDTPLSVCSSELWSQNFENYNPNKYILLHHASREDTPINEVLSTWKNLIEHRPLNAEYSIKDHYQSYIKILVYALAYMSEERQEATKAFISGFLLSSSMKEALLYGIYELFRDNPSVYVPLMKGVIQWLEDTQKPSSPSPCRLFTPEGLSESEWFYLLHRYSSKAVESSWNYLHDKNQLTEYQEWAILSVLMVLNDGRDVREKIVLGSTRYHGIFMLLMDVVDDIVTTPKLSDKECFERLQQLRPSNMPEFNEITIVL